MNRLRLPVFIVAIAAVPSIAFASQTCVFREYEGQDHELYFYAAADRGFVFGSSPDSGGYGGSDGYSNIGVWVDQNREVHSEADEWIDPRGHAHTTSVLRRQLRFNDALRGLDQWNGTEAVLDFDFFRPTVAIKPLAETGILDRETLLIPYYQAALRLLDLQRSAALRSAQPAVVRAVTTKLSDANSAVDELKAAIESINLSAHDAPDAPAQRCDAYFHIVTSQPDPPPPIDYSDPLRDWPPSFLQPNETWVRISQVSPEYDIKYSVDPRTFDASSIQAAALRAKSALDDAHDIINVLLGSHGL